MAEHLRQRRPVLNLPVRRLALQQVLREENITVVRAAIRRRAYVDGGDGIFVIVVRNDLDGERLTKVLLHEYAHIHLHMQDVQSGEAGEITRQLYPCRRGDVREAEADLLAGLLWYGEDVTPDAPAIAKLVAAVEAPAIIASSPDQLPLPIPEGQPAYKEAAPERPYRAVEHVALDDITPDVKKIWDLYIRQRIEDTLAHDRRVWKNEYRKRPTALRISRNAPPSEDSQRIKYYDETVRASRFIDDEGRWWWLYNFRIETGDDGKSRFVPVRDFMSRDIDIRLFVNSLGEPRAYRFTDRREQRAYKVRHLERQLAQAKPLKKKASRRFVARAASSSRAHRDSDARHKAGREDA